MLGPAALLALVVSAAPGPFVYAFTCAGTILKLDAATGRSVGHWEASRLLPKDLSGEVRDGCLLNSLQYDGRGKRLLAIVPREPRTDSDGNRNHTLVVFRLPSMCYGGSVDLPVPTGQPAEVERDGRVRFLVFTGGKYTRYESVLSPALTPAWEGEAREVLDEPERPDPAFRLKSSLAHDERPVRLGLDGKLALVEGASGKLEVFDVQTLKRVATGRGPEKGSFVCLAPGGRLALYLLEGGLQAVRIPGSTPKPLAPKVRFDKSTVCVAAPR